MYFFQVVIVGKQAESMFYVQPQTMLNNFDEMSKLIMSLKKTEDFKPNVGTICASLFEDVWYV